MSDWKLGVPIAPEVRGDAVTLTALRELPNSSRNRAFDREGAPIRDQVMLRAGVPEHYLGGRMFSAYMGLEDSFQPGNLAVSGGSRSAAELRQGKWLEPVEFSDFQVDPMTGDIFGEIRLAYWHDGERTVPVSGGSVSGNMRELLGDLQLSAETVQYDNWRVPALTRLNGVTVTGIEP
jgi:PmbA protein